jgi:carboxypeptidase Q
MRRSRFLAAVAAAALAVPAAATAQNFPQPSGFVIENPVLRRIWALGMDSSMIERYGQTLFDSLGPRLVAAPQMDAAQNWLVQTYQSLGITARREQYGTWRGWRRGRTHLDMVAPRVRTLEGTMLAWSPGTNGQTVRGDVIALPEVADSGAFAAWLPQAQGKFVLISFPQPTCRPDESWQAHATTTTFDHMKAARTAAQQAWTQRIAHTGYAGGLANANLARRLEQAGVAGVITSTWSQGWGVDKIFSATTERTPVLDVMCEDYGLLYRLADRHQGPVVELMAESENLGEVPVFNVIGEIRGRELPNEYVMLSAHFDSWDGGSGATDNGTGTITMLEAMRILKAAYPAPRRTIMVGHWSAEEMGLVGSRAFVADNPRILQGLQALFNQDNGTGRVTSMNASGLVNASANLARWLSNLPADLTRNITFGFPGSPGGGGTDHASFICSGAPGFGLGSEMFDYFNYTWHTNRDTYDKLSWEDLRNNATLTAMLTYLASEDPQRVPRERRTVLSPGPGGAPGAWPACVQPARATPRPPER